MRDLDSYTREDIEKLEKLIQLDDLIRVINYRVETVQRGPEKWKCFCPIHQEKVFRSLVIDVVRRTFRCSFTQCKGHRGGSLLDFYRLATGKGESETVKFWSERLKFPISPKAEEASAKEEETVPLVEPKPVQLAEYDDAKVKDLFERDAALERLEEAEEQGLSAEADLGIQIVEPEPAAAVEEPVDVLIEEPAAAAGAAVSPPSPQTPDQFVLEVKQRLAQGSLEAAEPLLEEALRRHRDHPELLHTRALLLQKKGEPEGAVHTLQHLLELYCRMHVPEGSLRAARQLLEIKPHDLQAYDAMVEAHLERHESDQAVRFLREAAAQCMRSERLEEALERLERILEIVPGDTRAAEDRIKVLCALNRTAQAVAAQIELAKLYVGKELAGKATAILEKAVEIDPQSREAHAALADLYLARGMQEQAVGQMQRLSELLLAADEMEEAIRLYQRVLKLEPKQTEVRNRLALLYRHAGEMEAALEEYFQIARIYREREMLGRAVRVYKNILKLVPDHLQARRMLMETLIDKDDASGAVEEALRLADALCSAGQESEAEEALVQALKWGAATETVQRRLIALYTRTRRMARALEQPEPPLQLLEARQAKEAVRRC
ncbi:MAG TPA: tetratricopeptide repeat protein, partial [Firmicutes bacterium]|nr:tetratricopeptide repeat protein [Bacillota bacterium]